MDTLPVRPEFPPADLELQAAFSAGVGDKLGGDLLMAWSFLHSFGDLVGLVIPSYDELVQAGEPPRASLPVLEMFMGQFLVVVAASTVLLTALGPERG